MLTLSTTMMKETCIELGKSLFFTVGIHSKFHQIRSTSTRSNFYSICKYSTTDPKQDRGPVYAFFAKHSYPSYDPTAPAMDEFRALCRFHKWKKKSPEKRQARHDFKEAMIEEFGTLYGTDPNALWSWQKLCEVLQISPIPDKIKDCRQVCS